MLAMAGILSPSAPDTHFLFEERYQQLERNFNAVGQELQARPEGQPQQLQTLLKRMEADYHAANAAIARARKAHPPPPPPPAPAPTEADLAFAEAVAAAERLPKPPFDPYDVVGLDGDGHSTGADFERAFEEDRRKRAAAASECRLLIWRLRNEIR